MAHKYPTNIKIATSELFGIMQSLSDITSFSAFIVISNMVFIRRFIGSISAGSTVDSISSSFLCPTGADSDCHVPPPYEEPEIGRPMPTSLSGLSVATATVSTFNH